MGAYDFSGPPMSAAMSQTDPAMMQAFRDAIAKIESSGSGDYSAVGPQTQGGDQAYGRYQVMGSNIPSWTQQALGKSMTPQQFLQDPSAQDTVFNHQWGQNLSKYGNANDAASVWFTGRPLSQGANSSDVNGVTGSKYVDNFNRALSGMNAMKAYQNVAGTDGNSQADLPAPGASPVSGQQNPTMQQFMQQQNGSDPNASMWDKFRSGGPGALLGLPDNSARPWDLGSALQGAGIAAMARDNPSGAAAMAQVPAMEARAWQPRFTTGQFQPQLGTVLSTDQRTGNVSVKQVTQPFQPLPPGAEKDFNDRNDQINQSSMQLGQLRNIQQQIMQGKLDPSIFSRGQAYIDSLAGSSNPNDQAIVNASHWINLAHQDFLKHQTGTQTDKDSEHAFEALMPGNAEYDPVNMVNSLSNVITSQKTHLGSTLQAQQGSIGRYRNQLPTGDYADRYSAIQQNMANDDQTMSPQIDAWKNSQNAKNAASAQPTTSAPRYSGSVQSSGGSLEGRTATNSQGAKLIMKGGKWIPLQ